MTIQTPIRNIYRVIMVALWLTAHSTIRTQPNHQYLQKVETLPDWQQAIGQTRAGDWLLGQVPAKAEVYQSDQHKTILFSNGLISRCFNVTGYFGCFGFQNLMTGKQMLRAIQPEGAVSIDGKVYPIGGAIGQFEYGYLPKKWLNKFRSDPKAFQYQGFEVKTIHSELPIATKRWHPKNTWPPKGKELVFYFKPPTGADLNVQVGIHYALYDGMPLIRKWLTVYNNSTKEIKIDSFKNEILSVVEEESVVGGDGKMATPHMLVESDYAFNDMTSHYADQTTNWLPDTVYTSQVNYNLKTPCLLESKPPIGPAYHLAPKKIFEAYHTFEMLYDSYDKERCGLAQRQMYRTIAPWVTENPIFLHLTTTNNEKVKAAIDQCVATGFEMVILSFGSGLNMEDTTETNISKYKALADYAHQKGIGLGGYSLFSSRSIDNANDVINPKTGKPGGTTFGNAPCLASQWGLDYLQKLRVFIDKTGFNLLEHDGPYPGDICAATDHPGHRGADDSQWNQWYLSVKFYQDLRVKDIYINAPDWYFLSGTNKVGMGYRETDWSLPRDRQVIIERQNIFDGTWTKTPSMGWTFVPLTQYHGGGATATIEPLSEHLDAYEAHLIQNFGSGVQACYRGPRLYDAPETKDLVTRIVSWYKAYREILNSDIIHLRRADGRDWDGIMHVNAQLKEKGLVMLYNPLDEPIEREIELPLYYTGLTKEAHISNQTGPPGLYKLNRDYKVRLTVKLPANGYTWLVIRE